MAEFQWRAFQGQGETFTNTLNVSGFAGTEILTASVYRGDTQTATLTLVPVWNVSALQTTPPTLVDTAITGVQLTALLPGSYSVLIGLAAGTAALQKGYLEVYPAPGGTPPLFERCLTTPALAQTMLPTMTQDQIDFLPFALRSATRAIETYCQRPLVMDSYDHILRPNNSIKLRLRARPIVEVSRVASTLMAGLVITYTGSAQTASVQTITGSPTSMAVVTLTFSSTLAGVTTTSAINVTTYATFDLLAAAINALGGGWGATVGNQMGSWSTGEAFGNPGVRGSVMEALDLNVYSRPLGQYQVDPDRGTIELGEFIPGGTLIANPRVERWDTRRWGVRCTYRAGYAVTAADIALGYYSVPEDLQAACVMTCYAIMESAPMAGPVKSQSVKDRSYTLKDSHNVIPDAAKGLLASYVEVVF